MCNFIESYLSHMILCVTTIDRFGVGHNTLVMIGNGSTEFEGAAGGLADLLWKRDIPSLTVLQSCLLIGRTWGN